MSFVKPTLFGALALALIVNIPVDTAGADTLGKIGSAVQGAGKAIKKGAENTGKAIVKGAENTGEFIGEGARKTGEALSGSEPEQQLISTQLPEPERTLFVQQATNASTNGTMLTLSGLTPSTYYFSDLPIRNAGHLNHSDFAALWLDGGLDGFKADPPNAVITTPGQIDDDPIVVKLLSATYDGSVMQFRFSIISGKLPDTAQDIALFIDANKPDQLRTAGEIETDQ